MVRSRMFTSPYRPDQLWVWGGGAPPPGVKQQLRESHHPPPTSVEVKKMHSSIHLYFVVKHRNIFYLSFFNYNSSFQIQ
jgi:hypothetical protein